MFKKQEGENIGKPITGEQLDFTPLTFGMHSGKTPDEISSYAPAYIVWLYENVNPRKCSRALYLACQEADDNDDLLRETYFDD